MTEEEDFEDQIWDKYFPLSSKRDVGPAQGFSRWIRINDERLFREEFLNDPEIGPVLREFVSAPFSVSYAQFKSSHRESEYFVHKPQRSMTKGVNGIEGEVDRFPAEDPRIPTLIINHENTLSKRITRSIVIADDRSAGQIIHKEPQG